MISPIPLDSVSITPGSVDAWLEIVAWVTVASILAVLWVLRSYLRYRSTDAEARRQLRELRPQLLRGTSVTVRIRQGFNRSETLSRLRDGFERSSTLEESDATIRDVGSGLAAAAADARPSWVPVLAWRGILEGAILLVVGLLALAPLAFWETVVDPSPPVSAGDGAGLIATLIELAIVGLAAFPYSGVVFEYLLATGILGLRGVWGAWLLPALILVGGGIALSWLYREIREWDVVPNDARIVRRRSAASLRLVGWGLLLWIVGVSIATPARAIGGPVEPIGEALAFLAVLALALRGLVRFLRSAIRRIRGIGEIHSAGTTVVVAYLVLRRLYLALALLSAGLLVGYVGYAIASGRLLEVVGILAGAPVWVLAVLALGAISLVVIVALQIPDVVEDLRDLSSRITRSTALRLWVFARGVPVVGTVAAFALVGSMTASILAAGGAAVVTGVVLRVIGSLIVRAKYAALRRYSGVSRPVKEVHVSPYTVEDADGVPLYVADVDGQRLVHRDRELLLEDVLEVVRERTETGSSVATESEHYSERVDMGYVGLDRLRTKLGAETRLETKLFIREAGGDVDEAAAREALTRDYPEWVVDDEITELRRSGALDLRNDRLVLRE